MKMLFTAIAMMIASPALAQAAPVATGADHSAHAAQAVSRSQSAPSGAPAADPHAGHDMSGGMDCCKKGADGTMACCAKMKAEGNSMACCDKMKAGEKTDQAPAAADPHAGHNMSPQ